MSESESNSTPSPSDAIQESSDDGGANAPTPDGDDGKDAGIDVKEMLLSTEPDERPSEYDIGSAAAHSIIGVKKMLNAAIDGGMQKGVPAVQNFCMAAVAAFTGGSDDGSDGEEPEGEPTADGGVDSV